MRSVWLILGGGPDSTVQTREVKGYLDFEVVHGVHGQRLDDLQVLEEGFTAGEVLHHAVVADHLTLAGERRQGAE